MEERKIDFWDEDDVEYLHHTTEDEAIESISQSGPVVYHEEIELCGYSRKIVDLSSWEGRILEDLLVNLEEEYAGEDGLDTTLAMEEAEKVFLAVVQKELHPWQCEVVIRKKINVDQWLKDHPKYIQEPAF